MSFLLKTARLPAARITASKQFSTSIIRQKAITDTIKDTAKVVDRTVADKAVKGIELGEEAASKLKQTVGLNASEAQAKAQEVKGDIAGQAKSAKGDIVGSAKELAGKAKGAAAEAKGKAKANL